MLKVISLFLILFSVIDEGYGLSVRFVTWNVFDNSLMNGSYNAQALQILLGPIRNGSRIFPTQDIYAVSVQENCYLCNEGNKEKLAGVFLNELLRYGTYRLVGISMTRKSSVCQSYACTTGQHGTTAMFVFSRIGLLTYKGSVRKNKCDSNFIHNAEKGIAGVKVRTNYEMNSLCFAGLHLDKNKRSAREKCIDKFSAEANKELSWNRCDVVMMGGDFNTASGLQPTLEAKAYPWDSIGKAYFSRLRYLDEMNGRSSWLGKTFISYINSKTGFYFTEPNFSFLPTYSVLPAVRCNGIMPCYLGSKTPAWTDRIICSGCRRIELYSAMLLGMSDHDPVIGIYEI